MSQRSLETVVDSVHIRCRRGRPRRRPHHLGGDRAYHARRFRKWLRRHGIGAVIAKPPRIKIGLPHQEEQMSSTRFCERSAINSF